MQTIDARLHTVPTYPSNPVVSYYRTSTGSVVEISEPEIDSM